MVRAGSGWEGGWSFYSVSKYHLLEQGEKEKVQHKIKDAFNLLEGSIVGPFVLGEEFSLADILVYPWLERWVVLEKLFGLSIPA